MKNGNKLKVGVFGATGYTGFELIKLLMRHPGVEIAFATSQKNAGMALSSVFAGGPDLPLIRAESAPQAGTDVDFLCLPHAAAADTAVRSLTSGSRVIDLSADFRLRDPAVYSRWYDQHHPAPQLLETAVYGLTEFARADLPQAQLVANPGCYPTSILLALQPLLAADIPIAGPLIADSKSGVSGAGRAPKQQTHFVEVAGNLSPYKIGRAHRHLPEIEQELAKWRGNVPALVFSPHLLPVPRGILSTIYVSLVSNDISEADIRQLYTNAYQQEPFINVLPEGHLATLAHVTHTNKCAVGLTLAGSTLVVTSAIDNLLKGAAGQAVQNMNVMFGLDEVSGLN